MRATTIATDTAIWCGAGLAAYAVFHRYRKKHAVLADAERRRALAGKTLSMTHALGAVAVSSYLLWRGPHWNIVSTVPQMALSRFSLGYFACDTLYMLLFDRDPLFLLHHAAGIGLNALNVFSGFGGYYVTLGLFLGELSNPLQIVWTAAREYRYKRAYIKMTPYFTYFFLGLRVGVIPVTAGYTIWHALCKQQTMPLVQSLAMSSLMSGVVVGGWAWCYSLWRGYQRFCAAQAATKKKKKSEN